MAGIQDHPASNEFTPHADQLEVNTTINLLIGVDVIKVNGTVIGKKSKVLLDLVEKSSDLYLDDFVGDVNGVLDCVEFLYGGQVEITTANIHTIVKFSVKFEVQDMYQTCLDWVNINISEDDIYLFINIGLMAKKMSDVLNDVLDVCTAFIKDVIRHDLFTASREWNFTVSLIKFLIQRDLLLFTLPVLSRWVENDAHIQLILSEVEIKGITEEMIGHEMKFAAFVSKVNEKVELLETSKKLLKLQSSAFCNLHKLACYVKYSSFSLDQILDVEEEYNLEHYVFVEILVHWITVNKPSQSDVIRLWSRVKQQDLSHNFMRDVRTTMEIKSPKSKSFHILNDDDEYLYYSGRWNITKKSSDLTDSQITSLLNKETVVLNMKCQKCETVEAVKVKFDDKTPCYEIDSANTHAVKHLYITWSTSYDLAWLHYSLIVNNYSSVIAEIKRLRKKDRGVHLEYLYRCVNNPNKK